MNRTEKLLPARKQGAPQIFCFIMGIFRTPYSTYLFETCVRFPRLLAETLHSTGIDKKQYNRRFIRRNINANKKIKIFNTREPETIYLDHISSIHSRRSAHSIPIHYIYSRASLCQVPATPQI